MKVIEDTRFFTPHQVHPVYNGQMGKFVFQLRLDNQLECPLHFYVWLSCFRLLRLSAAASRKLVKLVLWERKHS